MRKKVYNLLAVVVLIACSVSLASCNAITSQNITYNSSSKGMNGNQGMNGGQWKNNNSGVNGNPNNSDNFKHGMMNADLTGKVLSIEGKSITIDLIEQTQNNNSKASNNGTQNMNGNKNNTNSNNQSQRAFPGSMLNMKTSGVKKTITVNSNVMISQGPGMMNQNNNDNTKSALKVSDLKKGQIIRIWYKENTKTVERISVN